MTKQITRVWNFTPDSNPKTICETLQHVEGTAFSNCRPVVGLQIMERARKAAG